MLHFHYAGKPGSPAMLDDYVHMARAALTLFEITGDRRYLSLSAGWAAAMDAFHDEMGGGFFQAALARLYFVTGEDRYRARAEGTIRLYFGVATAAPLSHGAMLVAADTLMDAIQVVVVGRRHEAMTRRLLTEIWRTSLPGRVLQVIAPGDALPEGHPAFGKLQVDDLPTAYVCRGTFCSLPVTSPADLSATLKDIRKLGVRQPADAARTEPR